MTGVQATPSGGEAFCGQTLAGQDIEGMRAALIAADLPADDIAAPEVLPFRFTRGLKPVGYGALEVCGANVLLRSIVVSTDARGEGAGRAIVRWLLACAARKGAGRAFLFTTNARAYFEGLGFEVIDRSRAPRSILATRQAAGLCPASAALMTHALETEAGAAPPSPV